MNLDNSLISSGFTGKFFTPGAYLKSTSASLVTALYASTNVLINF